MQRNGGHGRAAAVLLALGMAWPAAAQQGQRVDCGAAAGSSPGRVAGGGAQAEPRPQGEYDVVLDVPQLCVERLTLNVEDLEAHVSLNARVGSLVRLDVGADVEIANVDLGIRGVEAQALLLVDLDNVVYIVDRTLTFVDENPQVVQGLLSTTRNALRTVGDVGEQALGPGGAVSDLVGSVGRALDQATAPGGVLSRTVDQLGRTVEQTVSTSGQLVERTLDSAGNLVDGRLLGSLTELPVVEETAGQAGGVVRTVRHATGRLIRYTLDAAGQVTDVRVLEGGR